MAIDRTGISSLESGAPEIKYTGDEGPQDPRAMTDIEKIILQHWLQQGGSYGDIIPEEFKQQIIQLYGLDKMASVPEMAKGGIARLGYRFGGHPHSSDSSTGSGQTYSGAGVSAAPGGIGGQGGAAHHHAVDTPKQIADQQALNMQQMIAKQAAETRYGDAKDYYLAAVQKAKDTPRSYMQPTQDPGFAQNDPSIYLPRD